MCRVALESDFVSDDGPVYKVATNDAVPPDLNVVEHLGSIEDPCLCTDSGASCDSAVVIDLDIGLDVHAKLDNTKRPDPNSRANVCLLGHGRSVADAATEAYVRGSVKNYPGMNPGILVASGAHSS